MIPGPEAFQYSDYNENNASANNTYDRNVQPELTVNQTLMNLPNWKPQRKKFSHYST